ncbi:phosphate ABC transporter substrate-binding protein PstS [Novosphingobium umbonatum]|uniref:Phosphate-binding protein PstS n=2 Tax=Novosphingobium umbonatum TaxID=1908524 RepID=A0A437N2A4_9SPHN|nr:phosphate ABC transporter substrate-binding protein PstS [Novosphingobium umbonatum]
MFRRIVQALGLAAMSFSIGLSHPAMAENVTGAGATFPASLYQAWARDYQALSPDRVNYQAIGSGGGVRQIMARTVDFGATDRPLTQEEQARAGLVQFPVVMGGIVPIVNVPGIAAGALRLDGPLLADIFLGVVKRWNDPRLRAMNPQLALPPLPITVVHRADGAGTTFLFTTYLAQVSPVWAAKVGAKDAVNWPTGLGGKGNDGVAAFVKQTYGSIGYVEFAYAGKTGVAPVQLRNHDGAFVSAGPAGFGAAAAAAPWGRAAGNYVLLLNQPGAQAWPISGATFVLMQRQQASAARAQATLRFFDWAYRNGDATAQRLHFVPLPEKVKAMVRRQWGDIKAGNAPLWSAR